MIVFLLFSEGVVSVGFTRFLYYIYPGSTNLVSWVCSFLLWYDGLMNSIQLCFLSIFIPPMDSLLLLFWDGAICGDRWNIQLLFLRFHSLRSDSESSKPQTANCKFALISTSNGLVRLPAVYVSWIRMRCVVPQLGLCWTSVEDSDWQGARSTSYLRDQTCVLVLSSRGCLSTLQVFVVKRGQ